jgi:hypothetical protein
MVAAFATMENPSFTLTTSLLSSFMTDNNYRPGILNQQHFDRYAAKWLSAVTSPHHKKLRRSFQPTDQKASRSQRVTFSLEHIIYLISSVGASYVEARFLLMDAQEAENGSDDAAAAHNRFTIALYATNAQGERVSAYYVSNEVVTTYPVRNPLPSQELSATQPEAAALAARPQAAQSKRFEETDPSSDAVQIPHLITKDWLTYWKEAREITPAMFHTSYGPLQGYTFSLSDFREVLFNAEPRPHKEPHYKHYYNVRVDFGLHKYYPAVGETCEPTLTFGLVLQLQVLKPALQEVVASETHLLQPTGADMPELTNEEVGEPFFDMSTPCPPGH